jgi:hypothetical protein
LHIGLKSLLLDMFVWVHAILFPISLWFVPEKLFCCPGKYAVRDLQSRTLEQADLQSAIAVVNVISAAKGGLQIRKRR